MVELTDSQIVLLRRAVEQPAADLALTEADGEDAKVLHSAQFGFVWQLHADDEQPLFRMSAQGRDWLMWHDRDVA